MTPPNTHKKTIHKTCSAKKPEAARPLRTTARQIWLLASEPFREYLAFYASGMETGDRRLGFWEQRLSWINDRPPFRMQEMEKRWGSCAAHGEIVLNPHLIKAPQECIDYVILHELVHLKHHNHGPEFWAILSAAAPDWERKKQRLDADVERLMAA
ncbi:M48 family metallopeptidase [Thioclava sp. GXIMD4216]|uniref:M48 metallopeptidase family protein n=1 Tax=Thioclava sp. GXIMD4216 TaxID=3131929 RepID=UPI0030D5F88E